MTNRQLVREIKKTGIKKIGRTSVVVLSLAVWRRIEEYLEDLEIGQSQQLAAKIKKARSEKKLYSSSEVKKLLRI